jgi:hypothetical protein
MDYDEFWQKWLTSVVGEIVKNNIIKSRQGAEFYEYVSQATTGSIGDS